MKNRGHIKELQRLSSINARVKRLNEILIQINISKAELSFYSSDEQLYLFCKIQEKGVDMGLCKHFDIFFSKKNQRFHYVCRVTAKKERTFCRGRIENCDKFPKNKQNKRG